MSVVKLLYENAITRVPLASPSFAVVETAIRRHLNVTNGELVVTYEDEDGDMCRVTSDAELSEAIALSKGKVPRFHVAVVHSPFYAALNADGQLPEKVEVAVRAELVGEPSEGIPSAPTASESSDMLAACKTCGRKFLAARLGKHEAACGKLASRKRESFSSAAQRTHDDTVVPATSRIVPAPARSQNRTTVLPRLRGVFDSSKQRVCDEARKCSAHAPTTPRPASPRSLAAQRDAQAVADSVRIAVASRLARSLDEFEVVSHKTQIVNCKNHVEINYLLKIRVANAEFAHVRACKRFPGGTALAALQYPRSAADALDRVEQDDLPVPPAGPSDSEETNCRGQATAKPMFRTRGVFESIKQRLPFEARSLAQYAEHRPYKRPPQFARCNICGKVDVPLKDIVIHAHRCYVAKKAADAEAGVRKPSPPTRSATATARPPPPAYVPDLIRVPHPGVFCRLCRKLIFGVRYKCCRCADYDLCEGCEAAPHGHNLAHLWLKIRRPEDFAAHEALDGVEEPVPSTRPPAYVSLMSPEAVATFPAPSLDVSDDAAIAAALSADGEPSAAVATPPPASLKRLPMSPMDQNIASIQSMGFSNRRKIVAALRKHNQSVERAVEDLINGRV